MPNKSSRPHHLKISDRSHHLNSTIYNKYLADNHKWGFHGDSHYNLCGVNEEYKILAKFVNLHPEQESFNIMDIGAGDFSWINHINLSIREHPDLFTNKTFNIFGLTGGKESAESKSFGSQSENIHMYYYDSFPVENMLDALNENLTNDIDLIVSRHTFRHLIDPLGTWAQAYSLLKPGGLMLFDQTYFLAKSYMGDLNENKYNHNPAYILNLLTNYVDAESLACPSFNDLSSYGIAIQKNSVQEAELPFTYYGLGKMPIESLKNPSDLRIHQDHPEKPYYGETRPLTIYSELKPIDHESHCKKIYHKLDSGSYVGSKELYDFLVNDNLINPYKSNFVCEIKTTSNYLADALDYLTDTKDWIINSFENAVGYEL